MDANYDAYTAERIKAEILAELAGTVETREGSYANTLVTPAAYQMFRNYQLVPQLLLAAFPDETAGEYIDEKAKDFGIVRTAGQKAHVTLRFTRRAGAVILAPVPAGTVAATEDGLRFVTLEDAVFRSLVADVPAQAEEIGRIYNVEAGAIRYLTVNLSGVESVTNPAAAEGGTDNETDAALLERYREHLRRPISSGNKNHYIAWAKEVSGIGNVAVVPIWNGPGTVKVIVAGPDKEPVGPETVSACAAHIEEERPIGAGVTVVSATAYSIDVEATVTLVDGHTAGEVQADLTAALKSFLEAMPYGEENLVRYSRVLAMLLDCEGVEEYHSFTLNGGTGNVTVAVENVPVVGAVDITDQGA